MDFATFTTIFYGLVGLIIAGVIWEKQFIKLEDFIDQKIAEMREKRK